MKAQIKRYKDRSESNRNSALHRRGDVSATTLKEVGEKITRLADLLYERGARLERCWRKDSVQIDGVMKIDRALDLLAQYITHVDDGVRRELGVTPPATPL